jgi:hypothetical protein
MRPYEASAHAATIVYRRGGNVAPSEKWRSNVHQRIVAWSGGGRACWLGRWQVDDMTVQVCFKYGIHADPVALASKAATRRVRFGSTDVAVVPIEYLLAESALRNQAQLTQRILHTMRSHGHDPAELERALSVLPSDKASRLSRLLEFSLVAG